MITPHQIEKLFGHVRPEISVTLLQALQEMGVDFLFEHHGACKTNFRKGVTLGVRVT